MTTPAPGQAAYEAMHASIARRQPRHIWVAWSAVDEINDGIPGEPLREDLEAAANAALGWWFAERDLEPPCEVSAGPQSALWVIRKVPPS